MGSVLAVAATVVVLCLSLRYELKHRYWGLKARFLRRTESEVNTEQIDIREDVPMDSLITAYLLQQAGGTAIISEWKIGELVHSFNGQGFIITVEHSALHKRYVVALKARPQ